MQLSFLDLFLYICFCALKDVESYCFRSTLLGSFPILSQLDAEESAFSSALVSCIPNQYILFGIQAKNRYKFTIFRLIIHISITNSFCIFYFLTFNSFVCCVFRKKTYRYRKCLQRCNVYIKMKSLLEHIFYTYQSITSVSCML